MRSLADRFAASAALRPDAPALCFDGRTSTWSELRAEATALAGALQRHGPGATGVLGRHGRSALVSVLAGALRGGPYVPLPPDQPPARLARMASAAGVDVVLVDTAGEAALAALLDGPPRTWILVDRDDVTDLAARFPAQRLVGRSGAVGPWVLPVARPDDLAWILFTSGSTGIPKAVGVTQGNADAFLDAVVPALDLRPTDRFSQLFELGFDLSAFDLFAAWSVGACVCGTSSALAPGAWWRTADLTVLFLAPSAAHRLRRMGLAAEGAWPGLRRVLFCGEALPGELAAAWALAAPNAEVHNLYGPTEATVACTHHRWSPADAGLPVVPIGRPLAGTTLHAPDGELWIGGPQVAPGYLGDPERSAAAFSAPPGRTGRWYRTGDRAVERATGSGSSSAASITRSRSEATGWSSARSSRR